MIGHHTGLHALNGYPDSRKSITAVDRNFVYAGFPDLYAVTSYDEALNKTYIEGTSKVDLISMLYDNPNIPRIIKNDSLINFPINPNYTNYVLDMQFNVIIAEGQRKSLAISVDNPCSLSISTFFSQRVACKVVGLASKLPGFPSYSSYSTLSMTSPAIISLDQMKEVLDKEMSMYDDIYKRLNNSKAKTSTPDGISKQGLLIKFKPDVTQKMKNMVYSEIKNLIDASVTSFLVDDIIETANTVGDIMGYIFLVLGIIALILSFFLIWTSFYANIKESICEYGITRSIGVTISQSTRIYLYEAASIIISSIITGTFIGVVISTTLILQFNIFVELPFIFNFPTKLYVTLVVFGLFMGMLGSYYPTYEVNHMSLVKIMKGLSE
jgi:ABC-type antimicrobial peptide transport system permease subunit